jgi:hypothetical protein
MTTPKTTGKFFKWFIEAWHRWFGETPPFFKIIQKVSAATVIIATIPDIMATLDIQLPELWVPYYRRIIQVSAFFGLLIAKFTTINNRVKVITQGGDEQIIINNNLPYTAAVEQTKAEKVDNVIVSQSADPSAE